MSNILFRDLTSGSPIYALIKHDEEIQYIEGSIVSISQQRVEMPQPQQSVSFPMPSVPTSRTVIDITYTLGGKNYTDTADVTDSMFATEKPGAISLIATDKEPIIRELKATLKRAKDYIKSTETEVPRNKKRIEECVALIEVLDTAYAEKQEMEKRIKKLEDNGEKTHKLLSQILDKLK